MAHDVSLDVGVLGSLPSYPSLLEEKGKDLFVVRSLYAGLSTELSSSQSTAIILTNRNVSNGNKMPHCPFSSEPRRCEAEICYRGLVKRLLHTLTRALT